MKSRTTCFGLSTHKMEEQELCTQDLLGFKEKKTQAAVSKDRQQVALVFHGKHTGLFLPFLLGVI